MRGLIILLLGLVCGFAHAGNVECLADNIYYEAAHEPYAGKVAVGQVVLNRARDGDVCKAVYAKHVIAGKKVAAFSWTLGRAWRAPGPKDSALYLVCARIASGMLAGRIRSYLIDNRVKWYHAQGLRVSWNRQFVAKIGHHLFYR